MKKKVLMYGPLLSSVDAQYGGGVGGYTRNFETYLDSFKSGVFSYTPSFHSVRSANNNNLIGKVKRFFSDIKNFLIDLAINKPDVVHILAQYRGAAPREFFVCLLCKILNIPYVYEIKAGVFDKWYFETNIINRILMKFIIHFSAYILVEGKRYVDFLSINFRKESEYWPNFVPSSEVVKNLNNSLKTYDFSVVGNPCNPLKVCFIGYCYQGKGVFELLDGLNKFSSKNKFYIELTFVGALSSEFQIFLSSSVPNEYLKVVCKGKLPHAEVLEILSVSNVFCLPSKHSGEGHNNSINEAMMLQIPIIATKNGFTNDILNDSQAWFIDELSSDGICKTFEDFVSDFNNVDNKVKDAFKYFNDSLHSDVILPRIEKIYMSL